MKKRSQPPHRTTRILSAILLVLLLTASCASNIRPSTPVGPAAGLEPAWASLWSNDFPAAAEAFQAELARNPASPEARRGLGLALFAMGDNGGASSHLLLALAAEPDSPRYAGARELAVLAAPYGRKSEDALGAFAAKEASDRRRPLRQRLGQRLLLDYNYYFTPDAKKLAEASAALGAVGDWSMIGPFSNVSGSGFAKSQVDEGSVASWGQGEAVGVNDRRLSWVSPDRTPPDAWMWPSSWLGTAQGGGAYYATATVDLPKAGRYRLAFERTGQSAVWIDGTRAMSDATERRAGDFSGAVMELGAGKHQILVKIASENYTPGFRLGLVPVASGAEGWTMASTAIATIRDAVEGDGNETLGAAILAARASGRVEDRLWLCWQLYADGYVKAALDEASAARKAGASTSALFSYVEFLCLASQGRYNEARNTLAGCTSDDRAFAPAVDFLIGECIDEARYTEARRLLDGTAKGFGGWERAAYYEVALDIAQDFSPYKDIAAFDEAFPDSPEVALLLAAHGGIQGYGMRSLAQTISARGLPWKASRLLLSYDMDVGSVTEAFALAEACLAIAPDDAILRACREEAGFYSGKIALLYVEHDLDLLQDLFPASKDVVRFAINIARQRYQIATIYELQGGKESGRDALRAALVSHLEHALSLMPYDYELREELRSLEQRKDLDGFAMSTEVKDAIASYEADRAKTPAPADDAEIVLNEQAEVFFGDGASRYYSLLVIKLLSKAGVERESSQGLLSGRDLSVSQAYVLKPDGSRMEARVGSSSVSFPGLAVGDYLVLRYSANFYQSGALASEFWDDLPIQGIYQTHKAKLLFVFPSNRKPGITVHNDAGSSLRRKDARFESGLDSVAFEGTDIPGLSIGRYMTNWRDCQTWVDISSLDSWQPVVDWYRDLYRGRTAASDPILARAQALVAGLEGREARIARLYDYVANDISYEDLAFQYSAFVPQRADSVLDDGFGDCKDKSALLVALLEAEGIHAYVALDMAGYRGESFYLPSNRFNHVIVVVPGEGGDLILDPTADNLTWPGLPESLPGTWFLPILPEGSESGIARVPAGKSVPSVIVLELQLAREGSPVKGSATLRGDRARELRYLLSSARSDLRAASAADFFDAYIPGLAVDSWAVRGLDGRTAGAEPVLEFKGSYPALAPRGGVAAISLPWATRLPASLRSFSVKEGQPVELDYPGLASPLSETVVVDLPAGYSASNLPAGSRFDFKGAYAIFHYKVVGNSIVAEREICLPHLIVAPADIAAFEAFLEAVALRSMDEIVVSMPAGGR